MADTCIVCLGDLATADESLHQTPRFADLPAATVTSQTTNSHSTEKTALTSSSVIADDSNVLAHIVPCGHNLHNDCLKPWVERANSCPICRQNFNVVELTNYVNGPVISSYAVQDKQQVADIDPSMIIDEDLFDEPELDACLLCGESGEEDCLLLCDGCNDACHTFCVGLDDVPIGSWFCPSCVENRVLHNLNRPSRSTRGSTSTRRRRIPQVRGEQNTAWARVWQSVWDNLNLDLDFPFDDDAGTGRRTLAQEREFAQWQRRFAVAERHGGAARFRDTAATLLDLRGTQSSGQIAQPESQDELRAWNAFEKARELDDEGVQPSTSRKRKSATASPAETVPEPERRLKRPRTRRAHDTGDASSDTGAEASVARRHDIPTPVAVRPEGEFIHAGPSFLRSLLKEVENSPAPSESSLRLQRPSHPGSPGLTDCGSPTSSVASPVSSNHPSPRLRPSSPSPSYHSRSSSPPLTSRIEPMFPHSPPQFSPASPVSPPAAEVIDHSSRIPSTSESSTTKHPRPKWLNLDENRPPSVGPASPTNGRDMSFSDKAEIQHMVTAALKPEYKKGQIDTDQYTEVNRDVSRMLYDIIGEAGGLGNASEKERWQNVAASQVDAALKKLKKQEAVVAA